MATKRSQILDARGRPIITNMGSAYEGGSNGRRTSQWYAPAGGPNTALTSNLNNLRNRSRAAHRNNPWLFKGIESLVANEVGTGIVPRSTHADKEFKDLVNALWNESASELDTEGVLDFYGQQSQVVRSRRMSGEVFIRRRVRRLGDLTVPLQVQVLESEYVPVEKNESLSNGNQIICGIEFNRRGTRVAYWMYPYHPAERSGFRNNQLIRVPARDVIHHYLPTRPGQVRGEPDAAQSLLKAFTFDSYDDAELVRKQTRAPFTGFLQKSTSFYDENDYKFDPFTGEPVTPGEEDVPSLNAEPGTILTGLPGEELKLFDGDKGGEGYKDFMRQQLLGIAAGMDLPYELLSGDWEKVNDRLVRAILNEFRRKIEMCQDHLTTHQVCMGVWRWWFDAAVAYGPLFGKVRNYAQNRKQIQSVEWRPQAWAYVNPEQDINAKLKSIEGGLTSRDAEVAKTGWDADEVDRQNVEGQQRLRDLRQQAGLSNQAEQ